MQRGTTIAAVVAVSLTSPAAFADEARLAPTRLASVGDSIMEAVNAEELSLTTFANPNHWASFVNGFSGFWEWLLGRTDVQSHNQRISEVFGSGNRANLIAARSGADSFDLADQTRRTADQSATYVPMFMGHNDVCQDSFAAIPTDAEFEANVRQGLDNLREGLPAGATVYVMAIVDIYRLWEIGEDLTAFGILDCRAIWATTLFEWYPCGTMLSPANSEADRQYTRSRIQAFNEILSELTAEYTAADPDRFYHYTDTTYDYAFSPEHVSAIDCFHPSAAGQRELSRVTWEASPFADY
jgi:lysophospholipase L1-like esterase